MCAWDLRESDEAHRAAVGALADETGYGTDPGRRRRRRRTRGKRREGDGVETTVVLHRGCLRGRDQLGRGKPRLDRVSRGGRGRRGVVVERRRGRRTRGGRDARDFHLVVVDCWGGARTYLVAEMNRREAEDIALTDAGLRFGSRVRLIPAARDIPYGGGGGGAGGFARARGRETRRCLERRARRPNFRRARRRSRPPRREVRRPPSPQVVRPA